MFIELVDLLRCPESHAMSYLVAAPREMSGRNILHGTLGCPLCNREYEIVDGAVNFASPGIREPDIAIETSDYEALRCAALLDLQANSGFAILAGQWGALAPALRDSVNVHLVLVNPPAPITTKEGVSIIVTASANTIAAERARGVAIDARTTGWLSLAAAAGLVAGGGRLVAPVEFETPPNARLLASDDRHWVAEVSHPVVTRVQLRRA